MCSNELLTFHNHCQHHLYWQESRTSASYLHHAPLAGAWEEMRGALPFSLEKLSSHLAALEQVSMICFKKKHNRIKNNKKLKVPQIKAHELLQKRLISAKHTSTEDGPDSEESGNGNETALYGRWEAISISYLNKSKLQTSIFHKKIFIVTGDIILRCYS